MDWNRIEGNWKQFKGSAKEKWGKLTDDDLNVIEGRRDQLEGKLQQRYGFAKDQAKRDVDDWFKMLTCSAPAPVQIKIPDLSSGLFEISSTDASPAAPPIAASADSNPASKHRDIFEERQHAKDDHDHPANLFGAAVQRQHADQIKNENDDKKGDEYADNH